MTSLVGRENAIDAVAGLLGRPDVRRVTRTGPGGVGKTRLAVAVGERLRARFGASVVFVPLAGVERAALVHAGVGRALGVDLGETDVPLAGDAICVYRSVTRTSECPMISWMMRRCTP